MASRRHQRRKQCGDKQRYPDQLSARVAASILHRKYGADFNPYRCRWCGSWHAGKTPGHVRQAIDNR